MQHLEVSGAVRPLKWQLGVKWLTGRENRENEMGRSCGKNGRQERYIQGFCGVLVGRHARKRPRGRHSCIRKCKAVKNQSVISDYVPFRDDAQMVEMCSCVTYILNKIDVSCTRVLHNTVSYCCILIYSQH